MQKHDAVLIRASTGQQDVGPQIVNCRTMMANASPAIVVPESYWYVDTRSRRKPEDGERLQVFIGELKAGRIRNVFVEAQSRAEMGSYEATREFFTLVKKNGAKLIDLRSGKDLTKSDTGTRVEVLLNSDKSERELKDTCYLSMRGRLGKLKERGSWPGGPAPIGFDKVYQKLDGSFIYRFRHETLGTGQLYMMGPDGKLVPGPTGQKSPGTNKEMIIKLSPCINEKRQQIVKDVFRWWTTENISFRQICIRLSKRGDMLFSAPFSPQNVRNMLENPAYLGHIVYGRDNRAELQTFDSNGIITAVDGEKPRIRKMSECVVVQNAHPALVDEKTWRTANEKLERVTKTKIRAPRDGRFWLKGILFCGHCGAALTSGTAKGGKYVFYECPTFNSDNCRHGRGVRCEYHRIYHTKAEALVMGKLAELGVMADSVQGDGRIHLERELQLLGTEAREVRERLHDVLIRGTEEYTRELTEVYGFDGGDIRLKLSVHATLFSVLVGDGTGPKKDTLWRDVKKTIAELETRRVATAKATVIKLKAEHKASVLMWAKADPRAQEVLKEDVDRLDAELTTWEARTAPLTAQVEQYRKDINERLAAIQELRDAWPSMEGTQKSEAVRGYLEKVVLTWGKEWKQKRYARPILESDIQWVFASNNKVSGYGNGFETPLPKANTCINPLGSQENNRLWLLRLFMLMA